MISMVFVLPAEHVASGNSIAVALNHDVEPGFTYSVPLSSTGVEPATHYGCRPWATPGFVAMIAIAKSGVVPDGTSQELSDVALWVRSTWPECIANLIADSTETDDPHAHWAAVIAANNLHQIPASPGPPQ